MSEEFYGQIFIKQQKLEYVPSNREITRWALRVIHLLYPEQTAKTFSTVEELKSEFVLLEAELYHIMEATSACADCDNKKRAAGFFESLPLLYQVLNTDIQAIFNGDPAARSEFEVIRTYPGFFAISLYRLAHALYTRDVPLIPRILTEYAHSKTGIDIHPAAVIGDYFYIDHGTGIVIGESCTIGAHVKLYQGVTLGALSVDKSMAFTKRHPTVEDNVVIYSGATILGGETVIGSNSIVGGNVWLTKSLPPNSRVYHTPSIRILKKLTRRIFGEQK
ncbi:serine acetyltransferase [Mucilaginibacter sp. KACC 22773]|uniref:serine O-acetyltransferase EpsC n=1 Tax=Mucilaginibacter sp. KACC 22773 TaxID=3025671 RepID=UPI00236615BC|nr:serine O-acetyltransferase EpsC [Mucilaginibacter sp. KACC 22773]WDF78501.1 serine acetyltransferase [Mucilaginibacter sp. KACC 22773]